MKTREEMIDEVLEEYNVKLQKISNNYSKPALKIKDKKLAEIDKQFPKPKPNKCDKCGGVLE